MKNFITYFNELNGLKQTLGTDIILPLDIL